MSDEQDEQVATEAVTDDDAALVAEVDELTKSPVEQQGDRVKSALIDAKRKLRDSMRRNKELEPIAARASHIDEQLGQAQPIINAILSNPRLKAEALRIASGTNTSSERTEQPTETDDPDAAAYAEDAGFYLADNTTPDLARARRVLTRLDARHRKQTDDAIRPLAGVTLDSRADANLRNIAAMVDDNDVPLATHESITDAAKSIPKHMLSDPQVADLLLNVAIGIDRRKGRTPKPVEEPVFMERQGGRRQPLGISSEEKRLAERLGLTVEEYTRSSKNLEAGVASRRGIVLGGK